MCSLDNISADVMVAHEGTWQSHYSTGSYCTPIAHTCTQRDRSEKWPYSVITIHLVPHLIEKGRWSLWVSLTSVSMRGCQDSRRQKCEPTCKWQEICSTEHRAMSIWQTDSKSKINYTDICIKNTHKHVLELSYLTILHIHSQLLVDHISLLISTCVSLIQTTYI